MQHLIFEYLDKKTKENAHVRDQKCIIYFAGIPGSGKSTLARILEKKLSAPRISSDEIREYCEKRASQIPESSIIQKTIGEWITKAPNTIYIIDASIDRSFNNSIQYADSNGIEYFIISIEIDENTAITMLENRTKGDSLKLPPKDFIQDHQNFLNKVIPNISLQHPYDPGQEAETILTDITKHFDI
jgi:predicted kinase